MNIRYNEYLKNTYENLINIANNWVLDLGDVGSPLYGFNGQLLGSSQKKVRRKSEVQIQVQKKFGTIICQYIVLFKYVCVKSHKYLNLFGEIK